MLLAFILVKNRKDSNKEKIDEIRSKMEDIGMELDELETKINILEDEKFEINQWSLNFKSFQQYLGVKVLKVIEGHVNKSLLDMRSDLRLRLEGFKQKTDGTTSEKITPYILRDGMVKRYGNFSGGEKARLNGAVMSTIQDMINSTNKYGGLNFLSFDEIFESSDRLGVVNLIDSFKELSKTVMITTQLDVKADCEVLKVVKEFGISKII